MTFHNDYGDSGYLLSVAKMFEEFKKHSYSKMRIKPGDLVLDVGCGPGTDTIAISEIVGKSGRVIGIDFDKDMLIKANSNIASGAEIYNQKHVLGLAEKLPFKDNLFNSVRSERVFQHIRFPGQVLSEIIRVTKPGGNVTVIDADFNTFSMDTEEIEIEQKLKFFGATTLVKNGFVGRKLFRLFKQFHLENIDITVFPFYLTDYKTAMEYSSFNIVEETAIKAGIISPEELIKWRSSLIQDGIFFGIGNLVMLGAMKKDISLT